jgi:hypothetical protein
VLCCLGVAGSKTAACGPFRSNFFLSSSFNFATLTARYLLHVFIGVRSGVVEISLWDVGCLTVNWCQTFRNNLMVIFKGQR